MRYFKFMIVILMLFFCSSCAVPNSTRQETPVEATVIKKWVESGSISFVNDVCIIEDDTNRIKVEYDGLTKSFSNPKNFKTITEGDIISVTLIEIIKEDGTIYNRYLK